MHVDWNYVLHQSPARIVAISAFVATTLQYVKRYVPLLTGWWSIAVNVLFSTALVLAATSPDQIFTPQSIANVLIAALGAAGIHGTGKRMFPDDQTPDPNRFGKIPVLIILLGIGVMGLSGCDTWERHTYQTLAATQATLNQAQDDYESGALPHSQLVYTAVTKAKEVQKLAVQAFAAYEKLKQTKAADSTIEAQRQIVDQTLTLIPGLVLDVKNLYTTVVPAPLYNTPIPAPAGH